MNQKKKWAKNEQSLSLAARFSAVTTREENGKLIGNFRIE